MPNRAVAISSSHPIPYYHLSTVTAHIVASSHGFSTGEQRSFGPTIGVCASSHLHRRRFRDAHLGRRTRGVVRGTHCQISAKQLGEISNVADY